jgi:hypothetical protein
MLVSRTYLYHEGQVKDMSEEKLHPPPRILDNAEIRRNRTPIIHRNDSIEHEYTIEVSPDLPPIRLRVFLFANGDTRVEAEFEQFS